MNIQSIRNKCDELFVLLDELERPDFILLTEHWLKPSESFYIPDYLMVSTYWRKNSVHGGTTILVKNKICDEFGVNKFTRYDSQLIEREFEFSIIFVKMYNLYVVCMYRPPSCDIPCFHERLENLLSGFPVGARIILAGDLNINFDDKQSLSTLALCNVFQSFNLRMHVTGPTRIAQGSATTLDYICSNFDIDEIECNVVSAGLSDHEAILIRFPFKQQQCRVKQKMGRIFSARNFSKFEADCSLVQWNHISQSANPLSMFHKQLCRSFNKCFPKKKIRPKKNKKPWVTKGIKASARNLRCLHYIRKFNLHNDVFVNYYNNYRRLYRHIIRCAKKGYYSDRISKAGNRTRENWSIINEIRCRGSVRNSVNLNPDILNNFYCSIAANITSNISCQKDPLDYLADVHIPQTFHLYPTNLTELKEIFSQIKNKNSAGYDDISVRILENLPESALCALVGAINGSFETGEFPSCLGLAVVVPLHKGGKTDDPSDYRPISLLATLSKVVEKLVRVRLVEFLSRFNILSSFQFGFQAAKSTSDAIFALLEKIYLCINDGEVAAAVFCDFSKAFDCVDREVLLRKLQRYGIRGVAHGWFSTYLSGRVQTVRVDGEFSEPLSIGCGVPQGSVLGPILFLLYLNDITNLNIQGGFTLFADDTTILWRSSSGDLLEGAMSEDLCRIKEWCDSNSLCLNIDKTKILAFGFDNISLHIENEQIENKTVVNFLGISIDKKLKFEEHIFGLSRRLSSGCFAIRVVSAELDTSTARMVYFSLFESHIRYGIVFWGLCNHQLFNSIFVLQKRAIRYMCRVRSRDHCRPLFIRHGILTLVCLFILETVSLLHKKYFNQPESASVRHTYETRQSQNIRLPIPRLTLTKRSIIYESLKLYNHLSVECRQLPYLQFRRRVKSVLVDRAYYSLDEFYNGQIL